MPVIHSRKIIETTPPGSQAAPLVLCEQCATWTRWDSPLALPTLPRGHFTEQSANHPLAVAVPDIVLTEPGFDAHGQRAVQASLPISANRASSCAARSADAIST